MWDAVPGPQGFGSGAFSLTPGPKRNPDTQDMLPSISVQSERAHNAATPMKDKDESPFLDQALGALGSGASREG